MRYGYKPHKISTIVDGENIQKKIQGYKPHKISTIVDLYDVMREYRWL